MLDSRHRKPLIPLGILFATTFLLVQLQRSATQWTSGGVPVEITIQVTEDRNSERVTNGRVYWLPTANQSGLSQDFDSFMEKAFASADLNENGIATLNIWFPGHGEGGFLFTLPTARLAPQGQLLIQSEGHKATLVSFNDYFGSRLTLTSIDPSKTNPLPLLPVRLTSTKEPKEANVGI